MYVSWLVLFFIAVYIIIVSLVVVAAIIKPGMIFLAAEKLYKVYLKVQFIQVCFSIEYIILKHKHIIFDASAI